MGEETEYKDEYTITLDEAEAALKAEIVIASHVSTATRSAKDLKYDPVSGRYTLRHIQNGNENPPAEFVTLTAAVAVYNDCALQ